MSLMSWLWEHFGKNDPDSQNARPEESGENGYGRVSAGDHVVGAARTVAPVVERLWNDYTGNTAVESQNAANLELAKYQAQMNEEFYNKYSSPQALMRQYQEAGLNPNLIYGSSGSGQGNVPSFNSPSVNRKLSGADQLTKALQLISGVMNVQNLLYNTVASREIAEQQSVRTLGFIEDVLSKRRNNAVEGGIVGYLPSFGYKPLFKNSVFGRRSFGVDVNLNDLTTLERYQNAMRQQRFNKSLKDMAYNMFEFGNYIDPYGNTVAYRPYDDWRANAIWRNKVLEFDSKQRQFTYDWDQDYKTIMKSAGFAGPVLQLVTRLLGGK